MTITEQETAEVEKANASFQNTGSRSASLKV